MANATLIIDKFTLDQKLEKRGFSHAQAEGIAESLSAIDLSELATKSDPVQIHECNGLYVSFNVAVANTSIKMLMR